MADPKLCPWCNNELDMVEQVKVEGKPVDRYVCENNDMSFMFENGTCYLLIHIRGNNWQKLDQA